MVSAAPGFPAPGNGKLARVRHDGAIENVADGLAVPTMMTFGTDGKLCVFNCGAASPGAGQVVRIDIPSSRMSPAFGRNALKPLAPLYFS
jgi:hypothetical protein